MFGLSAEAIQYLETIARASEASTQQIVSENQPKTGEGTQTAHEFVQRQLVSNRTELAQEGTNQTVYNYLRDKECRIPRGKGVTETVNDCIATNGGFLRFITNERTRTIDYIFIKGNVEISDAESETSANRRIVNSVLREVSDKARREGKLSV